MGILGIKLSLRLMIFVGIDSGSFLTYYKLVKGSKFIKLIIDNKVLWKGLYILHKGQSSPIITIYQPDGS